MVIALLSLGIVGAWALSPGFLGWLLAYLVVTFAYSFSLKKFVLVDVLVLSGLYTVRLLAGAAVTGTQISPWLSGFSLFLFLSLAIVKRFSELHNLLASGQVPKNGRGYLLLDIEPLRSFGTSSGYASVVVFALYISGHDIMALYSHPHRMWLICPLLIWWISRFWLLASRGEMDEDPVVFALTDRTSSLIGACIVVIAICSL
jgi:4-hydroxybenzoate polyprenyltransferase